jgi:hypothetical protein
MVSPKGMAPGPGPRPPGADKTRRGVPRDGDPTNAIGAHKRRAEAPARERGKSLGEAGQDREVGVKLDALKAADAERAKAVVPLQRREGTLYSLTPRWSRLNSALSRGMRGNSGPRPRAASRSASSLREGGSPAQRRAPRPRRRRGCCRSPCQRRLSRVGTRERLLEAADGSSTVRVVRTLGQPPPESLPTAGRRLLPLLLRHEETA